MNGITADYSKILDNINKNQQRKLERQIIAFSDALNYELEDAAHGTDHYFAFSTSYYTGHSSLYIHFPQTKKECKKLKKIIDEYIKDTQYPFLIKSKVMKFYREWSEYYGIRWEVYLNRKSKYARV
jgi:hypothetical protein